MGEFEVRQGRTRNGYFQVHHEWIDCYIPVIGTGPYLIWCMLSRYINREPGNGRYGKSYPSRDLICRTLKMRNQTFPDCLQILEKLDLVTVEKEQNGKNIYTVHEPPTKEQAEEDLRKWLDEESSGSHSEPVPTGNRFPRGTGTGSHAERVLVPTRNRKEIKEIDKEKGEKVYTALPVITKAKNEDNQPIRPWNSSSQTQDGVEESGVSRGLRGTIKPLAKWNSKDLLSHWLQKWEESYGKKHPPVRAVIEQRHIKTFLLEPYGPAQSKILIDRFFERRKEFQNDAYPTIGLQGLRQEWIVRKLLIGTNIPEDGPKHTLRVSRSEFLKAQEIWGKDMIPDRDGYFEFTGLDPDAVEWVDDV